MKKFFAILLTTMLTSVAFAQHRQHIENVTDYSQVKTSVSGRHLIGSRADAPVPCTGSPKIPVILVQFSDMSFSSDTIFDKTIEHSDDNVHSFYEKYCNGTSSTEDYRYTIGSVGSVKQYFIAQSDSLFQPEFVIIGPVTLPKSYIYYGKDASDAVKDVNISSFFTDAISGANSLGVDWTQFDHNNDDIVDFVYFIFAGEGQNAYGTMGSDEEHSFLIWPKEFTTTSVVGGKKFGGYGCTNEIYVVGKTWQTDGIGTMCHELSHGLGLPDFYDTKYQSFGLDYYDIMDSGNYCQLGRCPCEYNSYEREFMGWRNTETIDITKSQTITIDPIEAGGKGYKILNPENKDEYFLLENRQELGFDFYYAYVSNSYKKKYGVNRGLIVYHINYRQYSWSGNTVNTNSKQQNFTLLPADGELISSIFGYSEDYFNSMIGDLYPGSQNVTSIDSSRFKCWIGDDIDVNITRIQQNDDNTITIDINGGDPVAIKDVTTNGSITSNASVIYDLQGRVVEHPHRGVYIKDGKKYFVK